MNVSVVPFSEEHMNVALDAFLRFGKGRHPAGLNFGDCMAYAIASVARLPLLHLDTDFSKTDIPSA
jgi:ribonuclease VapC